MQAITTFVDGPAWDYFHLVEDRFQRYADRVGADLIIQEKDLVHYPKMFCVKKFSALLEAVDRGYEQVCFIDADHVIKDIDNPPNIFDDFDDRHEAQLLEFGGPYVGQSISKIRTKLPEFDCPHYYCSGLVVIRPELASTFIDEIIRADQAVGPNGWGEQVHTNIALWRLGWRVQPLKRKWSQLGTAVEKAMFLHAAACDKIERIQTILAMLDDLGA